jgi:hypothetical protein
LVFHQLQTDIRFNLKINNLQKFGNEKHIQVHFFTKRVHFIRMMHLGHPRVTVARQSDLALFALGINLANSVPLCMGKKVANHSP